MNFQKEIRASKQMTHFVKKNIGILLLLLFVIIGFLNFKSFGISWDEEAQHRIGKTSYDYVFSGNPELRTFYDKDYGVAFELPLLMIEKTFNLQDSRQIYLTRHLLTHLFFLISAYLAFLLIDFLYNSKLLASIGFLFLALSPLFYAHSFFNTKDIPFAAMFLICFYLNAKAFQKQKTISFIFLGIGTGLLINMRIMGVLLFCCILFFLIIDFFAPSEKKINTKKRFQIISAFVLATALTLYISWPFLWENPIQNFGIAFKNMSKFRWDSPILFQGNLISSTQVPWYYIPVWFGITNPIFYLIAGVTGVFIVIFRFLKSPIQSFQNTKNRNNLFFIVCFFAPILAVIILKSVLYDSWRQLFFIYPAFVLLAIHGLDFLLQSKMKNLVIGITFLSFGYVAFFMVRNNPFQHLYFNELVDTQTPNKLRSQYELDYWGTSYKQEIENILKSDPNPIIHIWVASPSGKFNVNILPSDDRKRIIFTEMEEADYFISNFRWHPEDYTEFAGKFYHSQKIFNNTIIETFKLK